ncbi:MAG: HepT-like ribonuclease domain-containing protein [Cyanobacteria bacterium J06626_4]
MVGVPLVPVHLRLSSVRLQRLVRSNEYGGKELLAAYPDVDWKGAKGTRDILSHHYDDVDAEVVFDICEAKDDHDRSIAIL